MVEWIEWWILKQKDVGSNPDFCGFFFFLAQSIKVKLHYLVGKLKRNTVMFLIFNSIDMNVMLDHPISVKSNYQCMMFIQ